MAIQKKKDYDFVELVASGARTGASQGDSKRLAPKMMGMAATLDVTAALTDATDILDVRVQTKIDGTNWLDMMRFPGVLGNGGAKRYVMKTVSAGTQAAFETGTGIASATVRNLMGDEYRATWSAFDDGGANQSFTFSVSVCPMP